MVNMIILVYVCIFALTNIMHPVLYISIYIRNAVSIVCVLSGLTQLHEENSIYNMYRYFAKLLCNKSCNLCTNQLHDDLLRKQVIVH